MGAHESVPTRRLAKWAGHRRFGTGRASARRLKQRWVHAGDWSRPKFPSAPIGWARSNRFRN